MRHYKLARTIGMKLHETSYISLVKLNLEKLILEKYLDIVIMVILNLNAWGQYPDLDFWSSPLNFINSFFTIIWLCYIVLYPIYGYVYIRMNKDSLETKEKKDRLGILYEEQRYSTLHGALFNIRAMIRRFLMVLVITVFEDLPYFQIVSLSILSFVTLWFIAEDNAYKT